MKEEDYQIIIHGSENSLDRDAYIIIPHSLSFKDAKKLCDSFKDINANLLVVENGQVSWCYKGTIDECNNSILNTYLLHEQKVDNPILYEMERNYGLKLLRTLRGLTSYCSRTEYRDIVKKALVSPSLEEKIEVLKTIDLEKIQDFKKSSLIETYKFFAFQMGQTLALLEDNVELFTKNKVAEYYPDLKPYLNREEHNVKAISDFYKRFVDFVERNFSKVNKKELYMVNFHSKKQILDVKNEKVLPPVVIFDIDGTLMNEEHRKSHRENKDWDTYFSLCDLDTPIQEIVDLTKEYRKNGYEIWLMTGRAESCKDKTISSMKEAGIEFDHLKMRSKNVYIPDYILKPAWVAKYIGIERVEAVYDDREPVIEGFRKKGLNTIDVKELIGKELPQRQHHSINKVKRKI